MCPVLCFSAFVAIRPGGYIPLLVHEDGSFLSRYQFVSVFRRCLWKMGLLDKEFSLHSFRIGTATEVTRWGLTPEVVMRIGRWESKRFQLYVRPQLLI